MKNIPRDFQSYKRDNNWKYIDTGRKIFPLQLYEEGLFFLILYPVMSTISLGAIGKYLSLADTVLIIIPPAFLILLIYYGNLFLFLAGNLALIPLFFLNPDIPKIYYWLYTGFITVRSWYIFFSKGQKYFDTPNYITGLIILFALYLINSNQSFPFIRVFLTIISAVFTISGISYISFIRNKIQLSAGKGNPSFQAAFNAINLNFSIFTGIFLLLVFVSAQLLQTFTAMDFIEKNLISAFPKRKPAYRTAIIVKKPDIDLHGNIVIKKMGPTAGHKESPELSRVPFLIISGFVLASIFLINIIVKYQKKGIKEGNRGGSSDPEIEKINDKKSIAKIPSDFGFSIKSRMRKIYRTFIMDRYFNPVKIKSSDTAGEIYRAVETATGDNIREITENYEKIRYGNKTPSGGDLIHLKNLIKKIS